MSKTDTNWTFCPIRRLTRDYVLNGARKALFRVKWDKQGTK